jgi:adhesin/invasin
VNVTVQVAGSDGSLGGRTTATSDATGLVRFSDLELRGPTGTRTLIFAADGFTPVTSSPITVTAGPPDIGASSATVPNGTVGAPTTIEIHVTDEFGNPVAGLAAGIAITVGGANPAPGLPVTEAGDGSYSASYVPLHTGNDEIGIQVNGLTLAQSPFISTVSPGPANPGTSTANVPTSTKAFEVGRIDVVTRDAQGNQQNHGGATVAIIFVQGTNRLPLPPESIVDNGEGTYTAFYTQIGIGAFSVEITLDGVAIQGSPYSTFISLF